MVIEQADAQKGRNVAYQYLDSAPGSAEQQHMHTTIFAEGADRHVSGESRPYGTADSWRLRTPAVGGVRTQDISYTGTEPAYWRPAAYPGTAASGSKRTLGQR